MAVQTARRDVTSVALRLDVTTSPERNASMLVRNRGTAAVYLGASDVTTATGFQLDAGEAVAVDLSTVDNGLYAIAASGTHTCHVLQSGGRR